MNDQMSSTFDTDIVLWYLSREMPSKRQTDDSAALNIRGIPRETFYRLKMAAAAEQKTVRELVLELVEAKIQELERKGMLPKGK